MINNRGFTLVEFLVAIVILMVGLLGMLQGINLAIDKSMENVLRNEALTVADDLMMAKRNKSFAALSTITTNVNMSRYTRGVYKNYSAQQIVSSASPQTKEVIVNISWKYKNIKNKHSVSSYVSTTNP
jgi:type IV pilus assembly protein PilV